MTLCEALIRPLYGPYKALIRPLPLPFGKSVFFFATAVRNHSSFSDLLRPLLPIIPLLGLIRQLLVCLGVRENKRIALWQFPLVILVAVTCLSEACKLLVQLPTHMLSSCMYFRCARHCLMHPKPFICADASLTSNNIASLRNIMNMAVKD